MSSSVLDEWEKPRRRKGKKSEHASQRDTTDSGPEKDVKEEWATFEKHASEFLHRLGDEKATKEEVVEYITDVKGETVTTYDIATKFGCLPVVAQTWLENLQKEGRLEHRNSGSVSLWWISETEHPDKEEETVDLPESIKGVLEEHQEPNEDIEETYERIKGTPGPEILMSILGSGINTGEEMRSAIENKRERGRNRRKELRQRFE